MKKYAIMCSPRVGSNFLCDMLCQTKLAGLPTEYSNPFIAQTFHDRYGISNNVSPEEYAKIIVEKTTLNDRFGIKVIGWKKIYEKFRAMNLDIDYWIYIDRTDKVLQAISLYKSMMTKKWNSLKSVVKEYRKEIDSVKYDYKEIKKFYIQLLEEDAEYKKFFKDKKHLHLNYENDIQDLKTKTILDVLNYIDVYPSEIKIDTNTHTKVRNSTSYTWKDRFLIDWKKNK